MENIEKKTNTHKTRYEPITHKLLEDSFVYNFSSDGMKILNDAIVTRKDTAIFISKHGIPKYALYFRGLYKAIDIIEKYESESTEPIYILCPIYFDIAKDELHDTQIGITGSPYYREHTTTCAIREMNEEMGITCYKHNLNICSQTKKNFIFVININNTLTSSYRYNKPYEGDKKESKKKVQILVYGTLKQIIDKISRINYRIYSRDFNTIRGLRILSLKDVKNLIL